MVFGKIKIGSKVRVKDFPPPAGQSVPFDFNGLEGIVKDIRRVGFGLNNKMVHSYDVFFEDVEVPFSQRDPASGKLVRGVRKSQARNWFDENYLDFVSHPEPVQRKVVVQEPQIEVKETEEKK